VRLQKSSTSEPTLKLSITAYIRKYINLLRNFVIKIGYENNISVQNVLILHCERRVVEIFLKFEWSYITYTHISGVKIKQFNI